jgi:hypothetical protein
MAERFDIFLNSIAQDVIEAAQRELKVTRMVKGKRRRSYASGQLGRSLTYQFSSRYNNPIISFGGTDAVKDYLGVVQFGRRKGAKMPPLQPIKDWMKIKPIRLRNKEGGFIKTTPEAINSAAWNIARSISKKGIEPFPFYNYAIESVLERRGQEINDALQKEIEFRLKLKPI